MNRNALKKGKIIFFHRTPIDLLHFEKAVKWIPDVPELLDKPIAVVSMYDGYAKRINPDIAENEVVIICDKSFPRNGAREEDSDFRHFVFILLHELAHVYKNHPFVSDEEVSKQYEDEADYQAECWFNAYAKSNNYKEIKIEKIKLIKERINSKWDIYFFDAKKKDVTLAKLEDESIPSLRT